MQDGSQFLSETWELYQMTSRMIYQNAGLYQKTENNFSCIPLDQAHEQNNDMIKGPGGVVGLTENPATFKRWMVAGPQQVKLIVDFEDQYIGESVYNHQQHEQSESY